MPIPRRALGFTLIELLVVIAIIATLAALSMPAFRKMVSSSKASACLSNLRQIGLATMAYANDNQLTLPPAGSGGTPEWALLISTYSSGVKDRRSIFVCPGCEVPVQSATGNDVAVTYGMHGGLMPKGGNPLRLNSIVRPTEVILAADMCQNPGNKGWSPYSIENPAVFTGGGRTGNNVALDIPIATSTDSDKGNSPWIRYRHSGKAHAVMCDGHVETFEKGTILNRHAIFTK